MPDRVTVAAVLLAGFALANILMYLRVRRRTPDAATEQSTPLSPVLAAYVWNRSGSILFRQATMTRVLACALVDLAVRGFIKITRDGFFTVTLERSNQAESPPSPQDAALLNTLFPPEGPASLALTMSREHPRVIAAASGVLGPLLEAIDRRHFQSNRAVYFAGLAVAVAIAHVAVPAEYGVGTPPANVSIPWTIGLLCSLAWLRFILMPRRPRARLHLVLALAIIGIVGFGATVTTLVYVPSLINKVGELAVGIALSAPAVAVAAVVWLEAPLPAGKRLLGALGEYRRSIMEGAPLRQTLCRQPDISGFDAEHPYALALGINDAWAAQCSDTTSDRPPWCWDGGRPVTDPLLVSRVISGPLERAIETALTPKNAGSD